MLQIGFQKRRNGREIGETRERGKDKVGGKISPAGALGR